MSSKIAEALARLDPRISVTRGEPASEDWIAQAQADAETEFCPTYVAFLREFGALRFRAELASWHGDFTLVGHAPEDAELGIEAAATKLDDIAESWKLEPPTCAPVLVMEGDWPDAGVTVGGAIKWFHRGRLNDETGTFEELALRWIDAATRELATDDEVDEHRQDVLGRALELVPAAFQPRLTGGRLTLTRPTDGVVIEVRFGDGREFRIGDHELRGVFAAWYEAGQRPLAELDAYNRNAGFVRAASEPGRVRYRGLLPATGLEPALLLAVLAHDAGLDLGIDPPPPPAVEDVLERIVSPPGERRRLSSQRWDATQVAREGDTLSLPVGVGSFAGSSPFDPPHVRARVSPHGLVEVFYDQSISVSADEALVSLDRINTNVLGDNNLDLEPCIRGTLHGDVARLSVVTTLAAVPTETFMEQMRSLARAIEGAAFLAEPDPMAPVYPELERQFGLPLGPAGRVLWEFIMTRGSVFLSDVFQRQRKGPAALTSVWGRLLVFAELRQPPIAFERHMGYGGVTLAVAVDHGATFDTCPIVAIDGTVSGYGDDVHDAELVAPDVRALGTLLVLGTSGYGFNGDDGMVWRDHRSSFSWFGSSDRVAELGARLQVEPASDIGALRRAAAEKLGGRPSVGKVQRAT